MQIQKASYGQLILQAIWLWFWLALLLPGLLSTDLEPAQVENSGTWKEPTSSCVMDGSLLRDKKQWLRHRRAAIWGTVPIRGISFLSGDL